MLAGRKRAELEEARGHHQGQDEPLPELSQEEAGESPGRRDTCRPGMRREGMSEWDILKGLDTVKAPPDFEQKVRAQLSLRKRVERRRRAVLRWSMAGSFASLAAVVFLLNVFVFPGRSPSGIAERGKGIAPAY